MKELVKTLTSEFADKEYAHAYVEDFSNMAIAAQIKVLREQRGWTQEELASLAGMKQERVSTLEDVNYDAWTVKTLRKLAHAFDLTVKLSFEEFSSCISDINEIDKKNLERVSRKDDLTEFSQNSYANQQEIWSEAVSTPPQPLSPIGSGNNSKGCLQYYPDFLKVAS